MLSAYPACFFKEETGYSVIFPDLDYTATCGETLEEAFTMAIDCLAGYLFSCRLENEPIPAASSINEISPVQIMQELQFESGEAFVSMITVDVEEYAKLHFHKSVKKTLTIPAWLNAAAIRHKINFSQVLQEALKNKLHMNI